MSTKKSVSVAVGLLAAIAVGCAGEDPGSRSPEDRGADAVAACRTHGGVVAFEDDVVICRDQTAPNGGEGRGLRAVQACRGRGGVSAYDDDVVICGDQTFHKAE
jgi:hypothetical protein